MQVQQLSGHGYLLELNMTNKKINNLMTYARHFYQLPLFTEATTSGNTISAVSPSYAEYAQYPIWYPLSGVSGRFCQLYCNQSSGYGEILITSVKPMKIKGIQLTNRNASSNCNPRTFYIKNGSTTILNVTSRTISAGASTTDMFTPLVSSSLQFGFKWGTSGGTYYVDIPLITFIYY